MQEHMKMDQLEYFGIPSYIIDIWKEHYSSTLLAVQEKAVRQFNLLQSDCIRISTVQNVATAGSLLVISPSSSGKTLIGEMAALQEISLHKKVIFLVPLRILAEEKYRHFSHLYQSIGLKVKLSSRDHRHDDKDIIQGNFHIAVIVYEKFYYLLLQYPHFLENISLLIADEIQLINDPERGVRLENIFNHLKINHPVIRIIALSAFTENVHRLAAWLNTPVLFSAHRPVELRKGIVRNGIYKYIEHNTKITGKEFFFAKEEAEECNLASYLKATLNYLINSNESNLIFFPTKREIRVWSRWLASQFCLTPARRAIEELYTMEDSTSREELISLLQNGIAYHCADLSWQERHLIEKAVRTGDIKIICATDTLSMGINLPVNNVILTGQKIISSKTTEKSLTTYYKRALTLSEVENMGGRAGRLSQHRDFGRIIFLAPSLIELTAYQRLYFTRSDRESKQLTQYLYPVVREQSFQIREKDVVPFYLKSSKEIPVKIEPDILTFLLHRIALDCQSVDDLHTILQSGEDAGRKNFWHHKFSQKMNEKEVLFYLSQLENEHLIWISGGKSCHITEMGTLVVSKGISFQTYLYFQKWLTKIQKDSISELEILFLIASSNNGGEFFISYPGNEMKKRKKFRSNNWKEYLRIRMLNLVFEQGEDDKSIFRNNLNPNIASEQMQTPKNDLKKYLSLKKTLLMYDWINGRELKEMEEDYGILIGTIQKMGAGFSWLTDTLAAIAAKIGWKEQRPVDLEKIHRISERLVTGIEPEGLALAQLEIPGLTRGYIQRLVQEGFDNEQCLRELEAKQLSPFLPKALVQKIERHLASDEDTNLSWHKDSKQERTNHFTKSWEDKAKPVLSINPDRPDQIFFCREAMTVNRINFQLISLLAKNQGKMVSYEQIINTLWPDDEDATYHRLWYHLGKLRNNMQNIILRKEMSNLSPDYIKERVLKVFPGRGLLLEENVLVKIK